MKILSADSCASAYCASVWHALSQSLANRFSLFGLIVAGLLSPLLVSADSGFSARDEAASFVGDAGGQFERRLRDEVLFGESSLDFSEWLKLRGAVGFDRVVTQRLVGGGVDYVEGLGFVRDVEVRYESPLGERAGNFGVAALGTFRESADDVVAWELRGYLAEQSAAGANVGVAYRRLVRDNLLAGVNAFLDYERTDADGDFWRWSAGVEAMSERIDFNANVYLALSDAVMTSPGGTAYRVYSADGWDAELSGRLPFAEWVEVAARYYSWAGDGGDEDKDGARLRLGFHPQPQIRFGLEYDSGDGDGAGNKNLGYYINFRHRLGSAADSVSRGDDGDVWQRRFDPVRREHKQNIRRVEATATNTSAEKFLSDFVANGAVLTLSSYFPAGAGYSYAVVSANPAGYLVTITPANVSTGIVTDAGAKASNGNGTVYFSVTDSTGGVSLEFTVFFRNLAFADNAIDLTLSSLDANAEVVTLQATDGAGGYVYALVSANPPAFAAGLQLSSSVVVDNGAATGGAAQGVVVYSATDADDVRVFATVSVVVLDDLSIAEDDITVFLSGISDNALLFTLDVAGGLLPYTMTTEAAGTTPGNWANLFNINANNGEVSDNGAIADAAAGGVVEFSVTDANGMAVRATVKFSDIAAANDVVSVNLGAVAANAALLTLSASGGVAPLTYAVHSATPNNWAGLLTFGTGANNNVVSDNGVVADGRAGVVVFSVADANGVEVFVTVQFGNLMVDGRVDVTLTSRDADGTVFDLNASGGDGNYTYVFESSNPAAWRSTPLVNLNTNNGVITDNGAAEGGAATATLVYSATDGDGYVVTATVVVVVLADVGVTDGDITLTLNPGDDGDNVLTITATGGDGAYAYTWESSDPASWRSNNSLVLSTVSGELVLTDGGAAAAGAAMATLEFSATDGNGFTSATAIVRIEVLDAVVFLEDNISLTLSSVDAGMAIVTLTASGTSPYTFVLDSADNSWETSLTHTDTGGERVITDNGIAVGGAAEGTLVYIVTDNNSTAATATIHLEVVDDLSVVNNSISLALDIDDAGDAVATLTTAGGVAPLTFAIVSSNPDETLLSINSDGVISEAGLHSIGGGGTVEFSVTDAKGMVARATVEYSYTAVKFSARSAHTVVTLNNKIYIIGGTFTGTDYLGDVWSSDDGINWSMETAAAEFSARHGHSSAVLNGTMYVIGGNDGALRNDVWSSADGITWAQQAPAGSIFSVRDNHSSAVLGDALYVIGGSSGANYYNDVWSSDCVNWTQQTAVGSTFSGRGKHASTVLDNTLYIIGGEGGGIGIIGLTDVWSSTDAINWVPRSSTEPRRIGFPSVALNGALYVIGGQGYSGGAVTLNDIRSSTDGDTWTEVASAANFSTRTRHASVVFNNRIYVLGGSDGANRLNDVWSSTDGTTWTQH